MVEIVNIRTSPNYSLLGQKRDLTQLGICSLSTINTRIYGLRNPSKKGAALLL